MKSVYKQAAALALLGTVAIPVAATTLGQGTAPAKLEKVKVAQPTTEEVIKAQLPSYPLKTCVISGEALGSMGDVIEHVWEGRLVRFCCKGCIRGFEKDPKETIAKIDAAVIAAQKPSYPLKTCVVSGEPFGGEMGDPVDYVYGTRYVKLCCGGCKRGMRKNAAAHMAKIDAALIEAQKADYPMQKCVVSSEPLDVNGEPKDVLYGVTLVRFCCNSCKRVFDKDPDTYLSELEAARKLRAKKAGKVKAKKAG